MFLDWISNLKPLTNTARSLLHHREVRRLTNLQRENVGGNMGSLESQEKLYDLTAHHMGVSKNRGGPPKWMVDNGEPY